MNIYLSKNNESQGPFLIEQVGEMVRKGEYMMSDLAWREGMADWRPIHALADIVMVILPPLPSCDPQNEIDPPPLPQELHAQAKPKGTSDIKAEVPSLPQSSFFLFIPTSRLIVLCIISGTLYQSFWVYRNWRFLKERDNLTIHPFWRGVFSLFYFHSLLKVIQADTPTRKTDEPVFSPSALSAGWIITTAIGSVVMVYPESSPGAVLLGTLIVISSCWFILPVQKVLNARNDALSLKPRYNPWSVGHILCLILGIIAWLLKLVSLAS